LGNENNMFARWIMIFALFVFVSSASLLGYEIYISEKFSTIEGQYHQVREERGIEVLEYCSQTKNYFVRDEMSQASGVSLWFERMKYRNLAYEWGQQAISAWSAAERFRSAGDHNEAAVADKSASSRFELSFDFYMVYMCIDRARKIDY